MSFQVVNGFLGKLAYFHDLQIGQSKGGEEVHELSLDLKIAEADLRDLMEYTMLIYFTERPLINHLWSQLGF